MISGYTKRLLCSLASVVLYIGQAPLASPAQASVPVVINEILANNTRSMADPQGEYDDWIELTNTGTQPIDVGGMYLTDDLAQPTRWKIPEGRSSLTTLAAKGYLLIWADSETADAGLHANFGLAADGEEIGLFDQDGIVLVDSVTFARQDPDVSYGRYPDAAAEWRFFGTPTPRARNANPYLGVVEDPEFSHDRGFFDAPFSVSITSPTADALIFYTLDGSSPLDTEHSDVQMYYGPIPIAKTTCLRAVAMGDDWKTSRVRTCTYLFLKDVVRQPKNPSGFPTSWGSTAADYEMDPDITNSPKYGPLMEEALVSLPTLSIVTSRDSLFGPSGIYSNASGVGVAWERPTSVEWINPDGTPGFQVDAGLRIYGGYPFRGMDLTRKKSFRLLFKDTYGPSKLEFPVFDAPGAATSFDTLILRAGANDGWNNWGNVNTQYIVDEFMRRTQLALGQPSAHGTFVHLYIDGLYWGLYNVTERPDSSFCATYLGGEKEEWDTLNSGEPKGGSNTNTWNAMLSRARGGLSDNASYQRIQGNNPDGTKNPAYDDLLDIDNYVDWMFHNVWGGTGDWPWHNWYAGCRRPPNSTGFKLFDWDAEGAIIVWSSLTANVTGVGDGAAEPYRYLRQNDEFRLLFADHAHRHLFHYGAVTPMVSYERYLELADQVEAAIIAESARWGDQAQSTPYTVDDWRARRDYVLNTYMPQRSAIVLDQLRAAGLYPSVEAPVFYVNGRPRSIGYMKPGDRLTMADTQGRIYYTLDGSDPRVPIARSSPGPAVTLVAESAPKRIFVPTAINSGSQLGNKPAGFQVTYYKANLTVSSLNVAESVISNPANRTTVVTQTAPVINFFNSGSPGNFDKDQPFPGTTMATDVENYVILVVGTIIIPQAGPWTFGVSSDDGFGLKLTGTSQSFTLSYPDPRSPGDTLGVFNVTQSGPYQLRLVFYEQGGGSELELYAGKGSFSSFTSSGLHLLGDLSAGIQVGEGNIWFTTTFDDSTWLRGAGAVGYERGSGYQGLIGLDVGADMAGKNTTCYVRIPFMADNAAYGDLRLRVRYDDGFIAYLNGAEVARRNFTGEPAWNSAVTAQHPDTAAAVFEDMDITPYAGALGNGANVLAIHGLNAAPDDDDFLISAELTGYKRTQGDVSPGATEYTNPITLARSSCVRARALDGQWSALNEAVFAVGPVAESLRISEIMYHPQDTGNPDDPNTEFIELKNSGTQTINLNLVQFTEGVHFTFSDTTLEPGKALLIVKDLDAFTARYGQGLPIAGAYSGSLDNGGETLLLQDAAGKIIHEFSYSDNWYKATDGAGFSLTVKDPVGGGSPSDALGQKQAWRPSTRIGGSPGEDEMD